MPAGTRCRVLHHHFDATVLVHRRIDRHAIAIVDLAHRLESVAHQSELTCSTGCVGSTLGCRRQLEPHGDAELTSPR